MLLSARLPFSRLLARLVDSVARRLSELLRISSRVMSDALSFGAPTAAASSCRLDLLAAAASAAAATSASRFASSASRAASSANCALTAFLACFSDSSVAALTITSSSRCRRCEASISVFRDFRVCLRPVCSVLRLALPLRRSAFTSALASYSAFILRRCSLRSVAAAMFSAITVACSVRNAISSPPRSRIVTDEPISCQDSMVSKEISSTVPSFASSCNLLART